MFIRLTSVAALIAAAPVFVTGAPPPTKDELEKVAQDPTIDGKPLLRERNTMEKGSYGLVFEFNNDPLGVDFDFNQKVDTKHVLRGAGDIPCIGKDRMVCFGQANYMLQGPGNYKWSLNYDCFAYDVSYGQAREGMVNFGGQVKGLNDIGGLDEFGEYDVFASDVKVYKGSWRMSSTERGTLANWRKSFDGSFTFNEVGSPGRFSFDGRMTIQSNPGSEIPFFREFENVNPEFQQDILCRDED